MATAKLIGADDATASGTSGNYIVTGRFQALYTGRITEIRVKATATSHAKVAIYADNAGTWGSRLTYNNTSQAVVAGWNTLSIPELDVTKDTYYWLADIGEPGGVSTEEVSGVSAFYKTAEFSTFTWPDPLGTGFSENTAARILMAGWGILVLSPSSIVQPVSYGTPKLNFILYPSGIAQALAYGTPAVQLAGTYIQPSGIEQLVALGTPAVQPGAVTISPSGIEQTLAYGTPKLIFVLSPSGIAQALAYGSPKLSFTLYPTGIAQPIVIGTPALRYPQTLTPQGISVTILYGMPSIGVYGIIGPSGIEQVIAIGSPQLLKYVWHVILDGQYITESPDINRAYVIGRDANGNPVYGMAVDSTELGLVGERLDFQQELAIPTEAQAASVAAAILAKRRLEKARGFLLLPPNCGQELWDVVQITDAGANQQAVKFRVVGLRFEFNPKQAHYQHRLVLGAP